MEELALPDPLPPNYFTEDRSHVLLAVASTFLALIIIAFVLRMVSRRIQKVRFGWDDGLVIAALLGNIVNCIFTICTCYHLSPQLGQPEWEFANTSQSGCPFVWCRTTHYRCRRTKHGTLRKAKIYGFECTLDYANHLLIFDRHFQICHSPDLFEDLQIRIYPMDLLRCCFCRCRPRYSCDLYIHIPVQKHKLYMVRS